jgi:6-phosphogluconolactonase
MFRYSSLAASALLLFPALAATAAERTMVYVANGASRSVAWYELDAVSGELKAGGEAALAENPGPLAIAPDGKRIYAALRASKSVQTLEVGAGGALTAGANTVIGVNPAYLYIEKNGRNLLSADYGGDRVTVHRLEADGTVNPTAVSDLATGRNPHSVQADPANKFAFAPLCGADKVLQFRFDPATGKLEANEPAEVGFQPMDGPRHFAFHPNGRLVCVINEKSSTLTSLRYDPAKGTMTPIQTLPTIPAGTEVKNSTADVHITPDGKYVYGSNRGHNSIAGFSIDAESGQLKALGHTPTEKTPRSFGIDPSGKYLMAAGQGSDRLATYRIDEATGALQPLKVYETGKGPAWVLIVKVGR